MRGGGALGRGRGGRRGDQGDQRELRGNKNIIHYNVYHISNLMCTLIFSNNNNILYISYYTILHYTRRREPPNVLPKGARGEKKAEAGKNWFFQKQGYDVTLRFSQLIIYKGRTRYIVT